MWKVSMDVLAISGVFHTWDNVTTEVPVPRCQCPLWGFRACTQRWSMCTLDGILSKGLSTGYHPMYTYSTFVYMLGTPKADTGTSGREPQLSHCPRCETRR